MPLGEDDTPKLALCTNCGAAVRCVREGDEWTAVDGTCNQCGSNSFHRFGRE